MGSDHLSKTAAKTSSVAAPHFKKSGVHLQTGNRELGNSVATRGAASSGLFLDLAAISVMPKLEIGAPDDQYEKEADQVADQVMRMPDPGIQMKCPFADGSCDEEEEMIQPKREGTAAAQPSATRPVQSAMTGIRNPGSPLGTQTRSYFEPRFGVDFSRVKIHSDAAAAQSANSIGAAAYTKDHHIAFAQGRYAPDTRGGRQLLAHELTHVIQQGGGEKET